MSFLQFIKSKTFFRHLGLMVVAIVVIVFLILRWLNATTNHGEHILVPDLAGKSMVEVRELLEKAELRYQVLDSANFNPEYPRFSVIEQNPAAGTMVKYDRKIYLTINPSGYKEVSIPNIIQVTRRNATSMLRAVGLDVGKVTYIEKLGKDMVYQIKYDGKYVSPGYKLPKTSKIELICGKGIASAQDIIKAEQ
jgi:beta-lactam-binding protein with PASTA domain